MQYQPPKKPAASLLLASVFLAGAASLLVFSSLGIGKAYLLLASALLLMVLSFLVITRYVAFDCLYRLGDKYSEPFFSCYVYRGKRFCLVDKIEFIGKEELLLLDKKGRKAIKKLPCRRNITSNLIPKHRYALLYEDEGKTVYMTVELDSTFATLVKDKIAHAKKLYQDK